MVNNYLTNKDSLLLYLKTKIEMGWSKGQIVEDLKTDLNTLNNRCRKYGIRFKDLKGLIKELKKDFKKVERKPNPINNSNEVIAYQMSPTSRVENTEILDETLITKQIMLVLNDPTLDVSERLRVIDLAMRLLDKKKAIAVTEVLKPRPCESDANVFVD